MRRNSVVLPAPLGPMTASRSPRAQVSETVVDGDDAAEAAADARRARERAGPRRSID